MALVHPGAACRVSIVLLLAASLARAQTTGPVPSGAPTGSMSASTSQNSRRARPELKSLHPARTLGQATKDQSGKNQSGKDQPSHGSTGAKSPASHARTRSAQGRAATNGAIGRRASEKSKTKQSQPAGKTPPGVAAAKPTNLARTSAEDAAKGSVTGLPLPRFAALRADDVNLRAGPGTRYPIEWLYKRRGLPVEIDREFEVWRLVTAPDGTKGWVHEATLTGHRGFVVVGADRRLRAEPQDAARSVAILQPGVVGRIHACAGDSEWCRVEVGEYRGWLKRDEFWGTLRNEAIASGY